MVCRACGYENQVGNRFCGMCGTPLPHRPLTAPGAQGTHSLTRVPLENAKPAERQPAEAPADKASPSPPSGRAGVLIEMPSTESRGSEASQSEDKVSRPISTDSHLAQTPKAREIVAHQQSTSTDVPPKRGMVPEVPLEEYVKSFRYVPPADSEEITMRGEAPVLQPQPPAVTDAPATAPMGTATLADTSSISPPEDVRERLGLEDAPGEERRDRPRFLDFSEPPLPKKPAPRISSVVGPSILGLSDAPAIAVKPTKEAHIGKPSRGNWRIWFAVGVFLVLAVLGVLEWRSQVNQTNDGPVEVIKMKIQHMWRGGSQAPQSAGSADTSASKQEMQVQEQPKPQVQGENAAANPSAPSSTSVNGSSLAPETNAGAKAGNPPQNITAAIGNQPPAGQKTAPRAQSGSVNGAQPAAGQNAAQRKPTPANTSNAVSAPVAPDVAQPAAEKAKPKTQAAQEDDQEVTVVPGEEEMAKAKNASDGAAAAAWLWKATAKGNPDAPVRLADMFIKGDGVPRNCEQALVLLKAAATKENARASNRLASMYTSGTCVQRNRVEAYRWLSATLVADPNSHWAQQNRELLWRQMTPEERTAAEDYR